jgi:glycosyltransferase involved in cell wall biosynthesis
MKLAFVNDTIYGYATGASVVGGAERQQWLIARALAAAGWTVTVGVRQCLEPGERRSVGDVQFLGIGQGNVHPAWYRFLAAERPDWWYWRCASHLWGGAVEIAKLTGVRTIFAAGFDTDVQPARALFQRSRWWPLYAWGLSRTDRIFLQHTGQLSALPRRWRQKAHLVPSIAGELSAITPHGDRADYVAWVAMLRQPKRPDVLVQIARSAPTVRFVVCGGPTPFSSPDGYSERVIAELQQTANVEFLGKAAPEKARQVIANAAVLLSTSDGEGFPNTFLEAWASGTPVVSLKIDPDGVIGRERLGAVPGTVESAVAVIRGLIESPTERDAIAARSREYVAHAHSERAVATAIQHAIASA